MTETVTLTLEESLIIKLDGLKTDETTSYTEIIYQIIADYLEDDSLTDEEIQKADAALKEVEAGNYYTLEEISEILDKDAE